MAVTICEFSLGTSSVTGSALKLILSNAHKCCAGTGCLVLCGKGLGSLSFCYITTTDKSALKIKMKETTTRAGNGRQPRLRTERSSIEYGSLAALSITLFLRDSLSFLRTSGLVYFWIILLVKN